MDNDTIRVCLGILSFLVGCLGWQVGKLWKALAERDAAGRGEDKG